ncbi:MAG: tRNA dihydrouridine synthase DusB [Clostridia bacterium]|nr:tRNA dihydrouridine synthase DusB [Clostridia bacterium]
MKIQNVEIENGICLAPLAGVSDRTFRRMARRYGAEYTVSEMVSAKALCYEQLCKRPVTEERTRTAPLAAVLREELPMAVQLFGAEPEFMARAAQLLESGDYRGACGEVPPSVIDVNMGCPMAKIVGNGEGSALMKDPVRAAAIVRAMAEAVKIPVTVKIRAGWDDAHINAPELAKRLEDAGAAMICVHGRTREQMYAGRADWEIIRRVKEAVQIPVVGNGDVFSAADALRMLAQTGCDGVMVARGAQGNPWIFAEILSALRGVPYTPPTVRERFSVALEHAEGLVAEKGERVGAAESRKHMAWYLHGVRGAAAARNAMMQAGTLEEIRAVFGRLESEIGDGGADEAPISG